MAKSAKNIAGTVTELLSPVVVDELGYILWDVEYVKEGSEYYLRITIDSEDGIDINDCERVHRAIDPILDRHYYIVPGLGDAGDLCFGEKD